MAFLKGRDGIVRVGSETVGHLQSWNVDLQADEVRGWGMGDTYETAFTTIRRWSGSFEVYLDPEDPSETLEVGDEVQVEFQPGGSESGAPIYSGTCAISATNRSGAKDGIPMLTVNFAGRGALTKSTVTA